MKKQRTLVLVSLSAIAAGVALAGCPGPKDDPPGSGENTNCQVVWANQGSVSLRYDIYLIDMEIADWTDGPKTYDDGDNRVAIFYNELLVGSNAYLSRAITTAGTFSVTATQGTAIGEPVTATDDGNQLYFDLQANEQSGVLVGTGGVANFSSNWSPPNQPDPDPAGRVSISYLNTPMTLGFYTSYATCYRRAGAFAPEHPAVRATRALREHFPTP